MALLAVVAVVLNGSETLGSSPPGKWTTVAFPNRGVESSPVLATNGDDVLVVTVSDRGVIRSVLSSAGGDLERGEPLETGGEAIWLAGAVPYDGGWYVLGSSGDATVTTPEDVEPGYDLVPVGFRSDDGLTWEQVVLDGFAIPADVGSLVEVDGALVALGVLLEADDYGSHSVAWRSEDGATWTEVALPGGADDGSWVTDIALAGDRLLAIGGSTHWTSDDGGRSWQHTPQRLLERADLETIAARGDVVLIGTEGTDDGRARILRSPDGGLTWSRTSWRVMGDLSSGDGRFFLNTGDYDGPVLYVSANGKRWTRVDLTGLRGYDERQNFDQVVEADDGRFVAMEVRYIERKLLLHSWPAHTALPLVDRPRD